MAQQARPRVTGQIEDRRAHCTILSTVVVRMGMSHSGAIGHPSLRRRPGGAELPAYGRFQSIAPFFQTYTYPAARTRKNTSTWMNPTHRRSRMAIAQG